MSRIFIKNLPPSFSTEELRSHFSAPPHANGFSAVVTDAKFIPGKRIGFIGYKNAEDAEKAVSYFNRSYIRLSRVAVEAAREVAAQDDRLKRRHEGLDIAGKRRRIDDDKNSRRSDKGEEEKAAGTNEKLDEYLTLMGVKKEEDLVIPQPLTDADADGSDDEYQTIRTKPSDPTKPAQKEAAPADDKMEVDQDDTPAENTAIQPISDADWLKSLTKNSTLDDDGAPQVQKEDSPSPFEDEELPVPAPTETKKAKEEKEEDEDPNEAQIRKSSRLFVRNLPFGTSQEDLTTTFGNHGRVESAHVCLDKKTGAPKGIAFVQFENPDHAIEAYHSLDRTSFQGRILHVLPADRPFHETTDFDISKLPYKKQLELKRRAESTKRKFNWNSLFMNPDAVIASTAKRFGVSKSDVLDPTSADAGVKQALAETEIIAETKAYFLSHGVDVEAFKNKARGDTAILVKNFEFGTGVSTLRNMFEEHGTIKRLLFPPTGTCAIIEFERPDQAKAAFGKLKYARLGNSLLFLEMAPKDLFDATAKATIEENGPSKANKEAVSSTDLLATEPATEDVPTDTSTIFIKNLSFSSTTAGLVSAFQGLSGFVSARVKFRPNPKGGAPLSMGFGFAEFRTKEAANSAVSAMNGFSLDGHALQVKVSNKATDLGEERRKEDQAKKATAALTKVVVKNMPFQATKKDIRTLLGAHGQLKSVRVPKKIDGTSRGFAFAEFSTPPEARAAMEALRNTHLLGRKLVIEFAEADEIDPEAEIERMQKKVGSQLGKEAVGKLMGSGQRQRFEIGGQQEDEY